MRLLEFAAQGITGLPDGRWSLPKPSAGSDGDVTLVTGPPGSGRTRWLEAVIAMKEMVGAAGPPVEASAWRERSRGGRLEAVWGLTTAEAKSAEVDELEHTVCWKPGAGETAGETRRVRQRLSHQFADFEVGAAKFEYFAANRQWGDPLSNFPRTGPLAARLRQSKLREKYAGLPEVLVELTRQHEGVLAESVRANGVVFLLPRTDPLEPYRSALGRVSDEVRLEGVRTIAGEPTLLFTRRDGERLTLDQLTDGERQETLFALWSARLGLRDGVVLIDGPELNVHPTRRAALFDALVLLWPGCQVLAATDAPELLERASVIRLTK